MRIILSPAKKMNVDRDSLPPEHLPRFLTETEELVRFLQGLSYNELKKLWSCNDKLVSLNMQRLEDMGFGDAPVPLNRLYVLTPAILSYEGLAFQYMAPAVFSRDAFQFVENHLRILSGFYGCLRPFDGVTPYRLEMQAKVGKFGFPEKTLYDFWGKKLYDAVQEGNDDRFILNLASKEYSQCIEKYLQEKDLYVTVVFGELREDGKVITKGTMAKMARGDMVRFLAENHFTDPENVKAYRGMNYEYCPERSTEEGNRREYVFLKQDATAVDIPIMGPGEDLPA